MRGGDQRQYKCAHPGCDKVFNRRDYLERHATNHLPVKPYVCIQCNRHFSRKDLFDNHLSTKRHARVAHEVEQKMGPGPGQSGPNASNAGDSDAFAPDKFHSQQGNIVPPIGSQAQMLGHSAEGLPARNDLLRNPAGAVNLGPGYFMYSFDHLAPEMQGSVSGDSAWDANGVIDATRHQDSQRQSYRQHQDEQLHQQQLQQRQQEQQLKGMQYEELQKDPNHIQQQERSRPSDPRLSDPGVYIPRTSEHSGADSPSDSISRLMNWTPSPRFTPRRSSVANASTPGRATGASSQAGATDGSMPSRKPSELLEEADAVTAVKSIIASESSQVPFDAFATLREKPKALDASGRSVPAVKGSSNSSLDDEANVVAMVDSDLRYAWFFDDSFNTEKSKYGYDLCYSEAVRAYAERSATSEISFPQHKRAFEMNPDSNSTDDGSHKPGLGRASNGTTAGPPKADSEGDEGGYPSKLPSPAAHLSLPQSPTKHSSVASSTDDGNSPSSDFKGSDLKGALDSSIQLHPARAALVATTLGDIPRALCDEASINECLKAASLHAEDIKNIIHRPTFDANHAHTALVAVLVAIGFAMNGHQDVARRVYPSVYLSSVRALQQIPVDESLRLDASTLETLQALCLLMRYERLILGSEVENTTLNKDNTGRYITDRFLWTLLCVVPHTQEFRTPFSLSNARHQPIWATLSNEAYLFHQGADPEAQWREWSFFETAKRTLHLAVYCDNTRTFIGSGEAPISLFNLDVAMVSCDALWDAPTSQQFFSVCGPTGVLVIVPYLGLIKALIRFPRVAQRDQESESDEHLQTPWDLFALQTVAHGLISIVGRLSGLFAHEDEMLEAVVRAREGPGGLRFDRRIQARLYRGLDVWVQNFSIAHGPVSDHPFSPRGSGNVPQYAMLVILCHYASFIYVHEDVPIVHQVTVNLKTWLETPHEGKSLQMLLDYLYMPLYVKWIRTDEAKSIVSTSAMYLAWVHAVTSQVPGGADYLFLSAMIYISTVSVWLYDFASNDSPEYPAMSSSAQEKNTLRLDNYQFMDDAITYLSAVHAHVTGQAPLPSKRSVHSVIMLSACLLYRRNSTNPLLQMLLELLSVMELDHTPEELAEVVRGSARVYHDRLMRTLELKDCPRGLPQKPAVDSPDSGDSDANMSDVEMSNAFLSSSLGHPMIA